jgi:hypothetical protein
VVGTLRQLAAERLGQHGTAWKRVAVLDWIMTDVFLHYQRKLKPHFSTIFLNSTAHLQHSYWRHMDPRSFTIQPAREDVDRFGNAILFGYRNMDRLVGEFLKLEREGTTLVFATALSQQPFIKFEEIGGQRFYRPRDVHAFLKWIGIAPRVVQPVMTHQYQLRFDSAEAQRAAADRLATLRLADKPLLHIAINDDNALYVGCQARTSLPANTEFTLDAEDTKALFFDHFYLIDAIKSGCHHPDGALWFKTGLHKVHETKVSILDILPTILDLMGIAHQTNENAPLRGRSLVPEWHKAA